MSGFSLPRCPFHLLVYSVAIVGGVSVLFNLYTPQKKKLPIPNELRSSPYYNELCSALEVALEAASHLKEAIDKPKDVKKKGEVDFVTTTDTQNEKIIFDYLKTKYPHYTFIGEEAASQDVLSPVLTSHPTWIVDPIDGTTNFLHSFPFTCVSIGLCVDRQPVVGVVVAPKLDEVYLGAKGCGAYLNGERMSVSKAKTIKDSLVLTELGYIRDFASRAKFFGCVQEVVRHGPHALRMMGSGVLDLCYVACGRLDVLWTGVAGEGWKPWDYCAGALFVEEAGGVLGSIESEHSFSVYDRSCVAAATPELKTEIVKIIRHVLRLK